MGPTGEHTRVLQLHPTLRCNLACAHCYSSSGPGEAAELPPGLLASAISDAASEGYNVAGFSGGEPLLYPHLRELLLHARACGMSTTVTTNGMLLDARRLAALRDAVCVLAISLDGVPASHARIRNSARAFPAMQRRLAGLRDTGIPFGFIFTLTQYNVHELEWVADFAMREGARLLQIHPLEVVGRAEERLPDACPDEVESAFAFLEAVRLQEKAGDRLLVQLDLTDRELLRDEPARVFADETEMDTDRQLSELVSPLVVETDGTVSPVQHGFPRAYALGNLHAEPLPELARSWRRDTYPAFRRLCRRVFEEHTASRPLPFFNWYGEIGRAAALAPIA